MFGKFSGAAFDLGPMAAGEEAVHHQLGHQLQMSCFGQIVGIKSEANRIHARLQKVDRIRLSARSALLEFGQGFLNSGRSWNADLSGLDLRGWALSGGIGNQLANNVIGILSGRFRVERGNEPVAQDGKGHGRNIFSGGVVASLQNGAGFRREDQEDASARSRRPK